jgi:hypothetical protein
MRMKKIVMVVSLLVVAAMAFQVVAKESLKAPVNKQCPVKKSDLKADAPTVDVKCKSGKTATVGVCCMDCKGKYSKEPAKFPVKELKDDPAVSAVNQ